jgi:hypothetical protein
MHGGGAGECRDWKRSHSLLKDMKLVSMMIFRSMQCRWIKHVSNVKTKPRLVARLHGGVMYVRESSLVGRM